MAKKLKSKRRRGCAAGICAPQRTQGLVASPAPGDHDLVNLSGPGLFVGAQISKQGGANDLTFVSLDIDGRSVTNISFAAVRNFGLTQQNPFGLVLLESASLLNLTIGFPTPLQFSRSLSLRVTVDEGEVVQILANVIHGRA
jgi:hypothetical protein